MTLFTFIIRRAASQWTRLATLCIGVLLATTLLAGAPALTTTINNYSLRRDLENKQELDAHLRMTGRLNIQEESLAEVDLDRRAEAQARLGAHIENIVLEGETVPFTPWSNGALVPEHRIRLRFYDSADALRSRIKITAGEWPEQWDSSAETVPVLITPLIASAYDLTVGSELPLSSNSDIEAPAFHARVVAIITPLNEQDDYWFGNLGPLNSTPDGRFDAEYSLLVPSDVLLETAERHFPNRNVSLRWNVLIDNDQITQDDIDPLISTVRLWKEETRNDPKVDVFTQLDDTLEQFKATTAFVRSPLLFIILIVVLLSLFYIVMVNTLSLAQTRREFAVLISRGANQRQILGWQAIESIGLVVLGALLGPLIAFGAIQLSSAVGPLAAVADPNWLISFPSFGWIAALLGGLVAVASSFLPMPAILRSSVVTHLQRQIRQQESIPWWQRYYVDIMLVVVGGILILRLPLYGNFLGNTESDSIDWLLILAPAFLLFGTATIFLRLFPPLLQAVAQIASSGRGLSLVLVFWQVARQPRHVSRLLLLLTITTALGLFSASLDTTLEKNEQARANFIAVGSQRLAIPPLERAAINDDQNTLLWRSRGAIGASVGSGTGQFDLLAIEPSEFSEFADFRRDFADRPVDDLLSELEPALSDNLRNPPILELPGRPQEIELYFWLREEDLQDESLFTLFSFSFTAKLLTATNEVQTVKLFAAGEPDENGWTRFAADIPDFPADQYPISILSIWLRSGSELFIFPEAPPAIDRLSVTDKTGETTILTSFEIKDQSQWENVSGPLQIGIQTRGEKAVPAGAEENLDIRQQLPFDGDRVLAFSLFYQTLTIGLPHGFSTWNDINSESLPALVTPKFLSASGAAVGDEVKVRISSSASSNIPISLHIVGVVNYFPTMEDQEASGSVITLRDPLLRFINTSSFRAVVPNEIVLSEPTDNLLLQNSATLIGDNEQIQTALKATPLILGLRTVTTFGYILSTVLSLAGFATYFFLNTKQHRASYAVLRALGLSIRQLYTTLLIEQSILVLCSLALGTGLGLILARVTLQNLSFRAGDIVALPPFELIIDWGTIATVLLTLLLAFGATISLVALSLWRSDIHRALRVGEE